MVIIMISMAIAVYLYSTTTQSYCGTWSSVTTTAKDARLAAEMQGLL
jgi:hypothetical protein